MNESIYDCIRFVKICMYKLFSVFIIVVLCVAIDFIMSIKNYIIMSSALCAVIIVFIAVILISMIVYCILDI